MPVANHLFPRVFQDRNGGDGGIRTLDRALQPYNGLANRRLQPLGHVSALSASATGGWVAVLNGDRGDMPKTAPIGKLAGGHGARKNGWGLCKILSPPCAGRAPPGVAELSHRPENKGEVSPSAKLSLTADPVGR